ncbi:MAG TPA: hypothetical protein VJ124_10110 [Pyrinomonadaceae bacterium]|nr:hypothetical protein [Pyrinomonadaceae bacterium]
MKRCPSCNRTYSDVSLNFCLEDGSPLINDAAPPSDPHATLRYTPVRETSEAPATEVYGPATPVLNRVPELARPRQRPLVSQPPPKKSNAIWWILGSVAVISIIGIGLVIMIIAIASISSNSNENAEANSNSNLRVTTRTNSNNSGRPNTDVKSTLPSSVIDDFSEQTWGTGNYQFGGTWYINDEYHMQSKEKTYMVMYGPSNDYSTENATIRVTTRNVEGNPTSSGYGLIVHGDKSQNNQLEDYAFLIYTGDEPQYEIVMHKDGNQTTIIPWTKSEVIRSGSDPNQLEVKIKGLEITFYANGQYLNRIADSENFKRGLVGFYTSESAEVAFDDLEIQR